MLNTTISLKRQAILSVAYGIGLRASEVMKPKVTDINSKLMLLLRDWWKVRPA